MTEPTSRTDTPPSGQRSEAGSDTAPGPWAPLVSLRREMDRLFDEFGGSRWPVPGAMRLMAEMPPIPALDLVETEGGYEMTAELPGIDTGDIELKVTGDMLTLRGEKRESHDRTDKGRHVSERRYGSFQRTLRLPPDADTGNISAKSVNGVLTVTIPRAEGATSREKRIEISGG